MAFISPAQPRRAETRLSKGKAAGRSATQRKNSERHVCGGARVGERPVF
jgi:hypothetical protein